MDKRAIATIATLWIIVAATLSFELVIATACSRGEATSPAPKIAPQSNVPLRLNREQIGTTSETSRLEEFLLQLFQKRQRNAGYRPGTDQLETTVYLWPEELLKVTDIAPVSEAIRLKSGARPKLHIADEAAQARGALPYPMALVLFMGNPKPSAPAIGTDNHGNLVNDNGINLIFDMDIRLRLSVAASETPGSKLLSIEIPKDGEYLIDLKPVNRPDLKAAVQRRIKEKSPEPFVQVFVASDVSWSSLAEVGKAAYAAGIREFNVATLVP